MSLPKSVKIREVGPREGFQTMERPIPTADKIRLIDALSNTGVKEIEITAFVRPDKVPQMADAEEVVRGFDRRPGISYTALYLNPKGFFKGEDSGRLDNVGWLYLAASETFLKKNTNTTIEDGIKEIPTWLAAFNERKKPLHGLMLSAAFGCNYEGAIPSSRVIDLVGRTTSICSEKGMKLKEVCLADTMGWATPEMLKHLIGELRTRHSEVEFSLHLHDTRGAGLANVYAGLEVGVTTFDASLGGLGGCPFAKGAAGNIATEDVAFLCEDMGVKTGLDIERYVEASRLAESVFGMQLPGKVYKAWKFNPRTS